MMPNATNGPIKNRAGNKSACRTKWLTTVTKARVVTLNLIRFLVAISKPTPNHNITDECANGAGQNVVKIAKIDKTSKLQFKLLKNIHACNGHLIASVRSNLRLYAIIIKQSDCFHIQTLQGYERHLRRGAARV